MILKCLLLIFVLKFIKNGHDEAETPGVAGRKHDFEVPVRQLNLFRAIRSSSLFLEASFFSFVLSCLVFKSSVERILFLRPFRDAGWNLGQSTPTQFFFFFSFFPLNQSVFIETGFPLHRAIKCKTFTIIFINYLQTNTN